MSYQDQEIREQIREGMPVYGADGDEVGTVKERYDVNFRIDRSLQRDVNVPYQAVRSVTADGVVLKIPGDATDPDPEEVTNPAFFPGAPPVQPPQ